MISLKRYIDAEHGCAALLRAMAEAYQRTLGAVGAGAAQACPSVDSPLRPQLRLLGERLAGAETPEAIGAAEACISARVQQWADQADDDLRRKTADVKELLVTLAHTAASVADSDAEHVMRFDALTARLQKIATLDDVTELRNAVVASARDLRASVEAMSESRLSVRAMQSELNAYRSKLEAAETLAAEDPLTGLPNRRRIETLIERRIRRGEPFSVGLIDLNGFKAVNDTMGHRAGDDLLRQFSAELKANARPTDAIGRWGGDEFIIIVNGSSAEARAYFTRVQRWVGGTYSLDGPSGKAKVHVDLSIGVSEWRPGLTAEEVIEEADRRMYETKRSQR